jgi:hypothetical protein
MINTNHWKSFVHQRLRDSLGSPASVALPGDKAHRNKMLADHLLAEKVTRVSANGREVDEFSLPPHKPDNHWLDCLTGCAVGASIEGITLAKHRPAQQRAKAGRRRVQYPDAPAPIAASHAPPATDVEPAPESQSRPAARRRRVVRYAA